MTDPRFRDGHRTGSPAIASRSARGGKRLGQLLGTLVAREETSGDRQTVETTHELLCPPRLGRRGRIEPTSDFATRGALNLPSSAAGMPQGRASAQSGRAGRRAQCRSRSPMSTIRIRSGRRTSLSAPSTPPRSTDPIAGPGATSPCALSGSVSMTTCTTMSWDRESHVQTLSPIARSSNGIRVRDRQPVPPAELFAAF